MFYSSDGTIKWFSWLNQFIPISEIIKIKDDLLITALSWKNAMTSPKNMLSPDRTTFWSLALHTQQNYWPLPRPPQKKPQEKIIEVIRQLDNLHSAKEFLHTQSVIRQEIPPCRTCDKELMTELKSGRDKETGMALSISQKGIILTIIFTPYKVQKPLKVEGYIFYLKIIFWYSE